MVDVAYNIFDRSGNHHVVRRAPGQKKCTKRHGICCFKISLRGRSSRSRRQVRFSQRKKRFTSVTNFFSLLHLFQFSNSLSLASNSTRATKNIDSSTSIANDQGSEIPNSADFYEIMQAFRSTKLINATLASSTDDDDSTWSENEATTKFIRQSVTVHDYSNLTDKITKS